MKFSSISLFALAALPQLFAKETMIRGKEPPLDKMTITQKFFSLGLAFQPEMDELFEEKLPTIEKLFDVHLNVEEGNDIVVGKANNRLQGMAKSYKELKDSIENTETYQEYVGVKSEAFEYRAFVEKKMPLVEEALMEAVHSNQVETKLLEDSALYTLTTGGKRLRPMLCLAAFEAVAGSDKDSSMAIPTAVSAELIHSMSLMTDDLPSNDNDEMRRGVPSNHVVYGENVAMLAAGSMVGYAFSQVLEGTEGIEAKVLVQVASRLARVIGVEGMAGGQLMDLLAENKSESKREFSLVDLEWIHLHKTASLIQYAVVAGGILGGASSEEIDAMEVYGHKIGLAFQVVDDLLDMEQDEAVGKLTYPKLLGEEGARAEAAKLIAQSKDALEVFDKEDAKILYAFADFLTERANK